MEYPMICFNYGRPKKDGSYSQRLLEGMVGVIVHEVGHNFFPMIVNSDERQWTWMDEGLNTFLERETTRTRYPDFDVTSGSPKGIASFMRGDKTQMRPIMASSDNQGRSFGPNGYTKPSAALTLLRETVMGPELFDAAFKEYAQRWAFKHPKPADFFRTMENASGEKLQWFWRGWFLNNWRLDVAVRDVKYLDNDPSKGALITIDNLEKMAMPVTLEIKTVSGKTDRVKLPVEIWERNSTWTFKYPSTEEIQSVTYDPDKVLPDYNPDNNVWTKK